MKKYVFLLLAFCLSASTLFAQTKQTANYESGTIKWQGAYTIQGSDTIRNGYWLYYHPTGQLAATGTYRDNVKHGDWKLFHPNGTIKDLCKFTNGNMIGTRKQFSSAGTLIKVQSYRNNLLDGEWKVFYDNGVLKETGQYSRGQRIGEWRTFQTSGGLLSVENYKVDLVGEELTSVKHGYFEQYQTSGQLLEKGRYSNGVKTGNWEYYHANGVLKEKARYDAKGNKIESINYNESGQVIKE